MRFGQLCRARFLLVVGLALFAGTSIAQDLEQKRLLSEFIGEVDAIIKLAESSASNIPGFAVSTFVKEMGAIRHSLETFVNTGHADPNDLRKIHGEYGLRLGRHKVFVTLYEKVLLLDDHVHAAKSKADSIYQVEYEILEIELDIVEVGLEGVMGG